MRKEEDEDQRVRNLFREITKLLPERSKIKTDLLYFKYAPSCLKKMKQERMGERMPDYRDDWRREREEREERENRRRFNNVNDDWNYPNRYGERGGGGYNGGGR